MICGVDWVTAHAADIEVANMSLAGPGAQGSCNDGALREAICRSVASGVTYIAAAGNSAVDVSGQVPGSFPEVITVSALSDYDGLPGGLGRSTANCGPAGRHAGRLLQLRRRHRPHRPRRVHHVHLEGQVATRPQRYLHGLAPRDRGGGAVPLRPPGAFPRPPSRARPEDGREPLWNTAADQGQDKETLLNVDSLIGTTTGSAASSPADD